MKFWTVALLCCINLAARSEEPPVIINEIMYHPSSDLATDEYIELYNLGEQAVDLSGWYFSDGIRYTFPAGSEIPSGGYLVVAKDPNQIRRKYNLKSALGGFSGELSNHGERIALSQANGKLVDEVLYSDSPPWPVAADERGPSLECINPLADNAAAANWDISQGTGTPGQRNSVAQSSIPPFIGTIQQDPKKPESTNYVTLSTQVTGGENIRSVSVEYTFDEKTLWAEMMDDGLHGDGQKDDGVYGVQLAPQPSQTAVFYAVYAQDDLGRVGRSPRTSDPAPRHGYFVFDGSTDTDLPIYFVFVSQANLNKLNQNPDSDNMVEATVAVDGQVFDQVQVRYRGAWARSWPKKSWKIRFNKGYYYKGWRTSNLNSEYHDRAYMREQTGYDLFRDAGVPCPESRFVWMQLNGKPFGLYCEIEQPDERYLERIEREGGSLYKSEGRYNVLGSTSSYQSIYQKETNTSESYDSLITMIEEINNIPDSQVYDYFIQHFNIETYIDYLVVNTCISNWDSIVKNHFIFQDTEETGQWEFLPWDLDRTWGEFPDWNIYYNQDILAGIQGHPGPQLGSDWWNRVQNRFLRNKTFLEMYDNRLRQFTETMFTEERMNERIDAYDQMIRDEVPLEQQIHGTHGSWVYADEVTRLKWYVKNRRNFIFQSLPTAINDWMFY